MAYGAYRHVTGELFFATGLFICASTCATALLLFTSVTSGRFVVGRNDRGLATSLWEQTMWLRFVHWENTILM